MAIRFTNPNLILKGTATAYLQDPATNNIVFADDKFQTGNIATTVDMGEIRGGLMSPVIGMLPSNAALTVAFATPVFSMFAKAAQTGATLSYGAPVMVCQTVTASGESLTIDVTGGVPVAGLGMDSVVCFVQEVGAASPVETGGVAYEISAAGVVSGFAATNGKTYKVWYHVARANAQLATISSAIDPKLLRFTAIFAVYDTTGTTGTNGGTHIGNLHVIVPRLKLGGDNGGIVGDQTTNDTTTINGQALAYSPSTIDGSCDDCAGGGNPFAYYIYVPCDTTSGVEGVVAQLGGVITVAASGTYQMRPAVVVNGELVRNIDPADFTYSGTGLPSGTTVSGSGLIEAGATSGDGEISVSYVVGSTTYTDVVNASVTST